MVKECHYNCEARKIIVPIMLAIITSAVTDADFSLNLTFTILWAFSADDKLMMFFLFS